MKNINDMKGREPTSLLECNGFCGSNDFETESYEDLHLDSSVSMNDFFE